MDKRTGSEDKRPDSEVCDADDADKQFIEYEQRDAADSNLKKRRSGTKEKMSNIELHGQIHCSKSNGGKLPFSRGSHLEIIFLIIRCGISGCNSSRVSIIHSAMIPVWSE